MNSELFEHIASRTFIVIPSKDESKHIGALIQETFLHGYKNVVVVDDGSTDNTAAIANQLGAYVVRHKINMGPGAATQTGMSFALLKGAEYIVTIDADFQLFPQDILPLLKEIQTKNLDIVIGSRFLKYENKIPLSRRAYNWVGNWITYFLTGIKVTDSQSGLKVFTAEFAKKSKLKFNGFEFCMEIIRYIYHNNAKYSEIPVHVIYTKETMRKGQTFHSGLMMLARWFGSIRAGFDFGMVIHIEVLVHVLLYSGYIATTNP